MTNIDPYYHPFKEVGHPNRLRPTNLPSNLSVYLLCNSKDKREIYVYKERQEIISNKVEYKNVSLLFVNLKQSLGNCLYITQILDIYGEQLHTELPHVINGKKINIYRLRKGNVRVYFIIIGSSMVLFRLSLKKENKISKSERKIITDRVDVICKVPPDENQNLRRIIL